MDEGGVGLAGGGGVLHELRGDEAGEVDEGRDLGGLVEGGVGVGGGGVDAEVDGASPAGAGDERGVGGDG